MTREQLQQSLADLSKLALKAHLAVKRGIPESETSVRVRLVRARAELIEDAWHENR